MYKIFNPHVEQKTDKKNVCIVCRNSIDRVKNFESRAKLLVLINSFLNYSSQGEKQSLSKSLKVA